MKRRLIFTVEYSLLCAVATFFLITVFGKQYQLNRFLIVPCVATLPGAFLSSRLHFDAKSRFWHLRIGILALVYSLILYGVGFFMLRINAHQIGLPSAVIYAIGDTWKSFVSGALFMIPGFVLLSYVPKGKEKDKSDKDNRLTSLPPKPWERPREDILEDNEDNEENEK